MLSLVVAGIEEGRSAQSKPSVDFKKQDGRKIMRRPTPSLIEPEHDMSISKDRTQHDSSLSMIIPFYRSREARARTSLWEVPDGKRYARQREDDPMRNRKLNGWNLEESVQEIKN